MSGARSRGRGQVHLAATISLTLLTVATVISLCRIYPDWAFLRPMVIVVVGVHVVAAVLRSVRTPLWLALPVLAFAGFELTALVYYSSTMKGPLPTRETIDLMRLDLRLVIDLFPRTVAPVPSEGSFASTTAMAMAACAILADTFAFRAYGRVEAVVPTAVMFIFTAALGTDRNEVAVTVLWLAMAVITVAVMRFDAQDDEVSWMGARTVRLAAAIPAIVLVAGVSAVAAGALAPRLPGADAEALIDTRNRQGGITEVLSPLVDIRSTMVNRGNLELFVVTTNNGGGHYWRQMGLSEFDGTAWEPTNEDLQDMGDRSDEVPLIGTRIEQRIQISEMKGTLLPVAYHPVSVQPDVFAWAPESQTLLLPEGAGQFESGDEILVDSVVVRPSPELLRAATNDDPPGGDYTDLPGNVPDTAYDLAASVTAGQPTTYDKLIALQNFFHDKFKYDLKVQLGNSNDAIEAFLRDRRGFCQQFAGTFAVMARTLGIPTRVAVGYTQGELDAQGRYRVYGRHAHAWPEVWFDGVGWVAFEPTPGRGSPDDEGYTGVAPGQASRSESPAGGDVLPPVSTTPVSVPREGVGTTVAGGRPGEGGATTLPPSAVAPRGSHGVPVKELTILGLLIFALLWIAFLPRFMASRSRRQLHGATDRVIASWYRACVALEFAGVPQIGGETPLEYAVTAEREAGVDHHTMRELALQVTRAVYARQSIADYEASRCETLCADVEEMCKERTPWRMRFMQRVDPRLVRRKLAM